jgi:hypothetical protein
MSCVICGGNLEYTFSLGNHPMCDDLIPVGSSSVNNEYPIEINYCNKCFTAFQANEISAPLLFPQSYHYRSRFTADVLEGMNNLVSSVEGYVGNIDRKIVLDIGCNDGSLLGFFRDKGAMTLGVEPTSASSDALSSGHTVYEGFFGYEMSQKIISDHPKIDIITFTNVFAHINDFSDLIKGLMNLLSKDTLVVIENHYLGSVLDGNQFDTFYHEHPRTYSAESFKYIAKLLGRKLQAVEFPSRYGGNIRVFIGSGHSGSSLNNALDNLEEDKFYEKLMGIPSIIHNWRNVKLEQISSLVNKYGPLPAKAFPGRAAILIKLLGLDVDSISVVYEKVGSKKVGYYVPGTRIPIKSDEDVSYDVLNKPIINLAWHISVEIKEYLVAKGFSGSIIDILSIEDFKCVTTTVSGKA